MKHGSPNNRNFTIQPNACRRIFFQPRNSIRFFISLVLVTYKFSRYIMRIFTGVFISFCLIYSPAYSLERDYPDAQVLSACMQAAIPEIGKRSSLLTGKLVYVAPKGASSLFFVSDAQLRGELDWENWATLSAPLEVLRRRAKEGWNPPQSIFIEGLDVMVSDPPKEKNTTSKSLYFVFWPPGYSDDLSTGIVRAAFGPSAHGATVTCAFAKRGDSWIIVNKWVAFYA